MAGDSAHVVLDGLAHAKTLRSMVVCAAFSNVCLVLSAVCYVDLTITHSLVEDMSMRPCLHRLKSRELLMLEVVS